MKLRRSRSLAGLALCAACTSTQDERLENPLTGEPYGPGVVAQGWFGLNRVETRDLDVDPGVGNVQEVQDASLPALGGAFFKPLGGERLEYGLEAGLSLGWQGDIDTIAIGGGGVAIAGTTDVFLTDLFGGPNLTWHCGGKGRLYFAAGLVLEWASFDLEWNDPVSGAVQVDDDGFGGGYYGRTGFEWELEPGTWIGLGVRFVETAIDPGGQIDDVDLRQMQYLFTMTRSL